MKVDLNEWIETAKVSDLKPGDTFKHNNVLYMKIEQVYKEPRCYSYCNVYNLENDKIDFITPSSEVEVIHCKVVEDDGVDGKCV